MCSGADKEWHRSIAVRMKMVKRPPPNLKPSGIERKSIGRGNKDTSNSAGNNSSGMFLRTMILSFSDNVIPSRSSARCQNSCTQDHLNSVQIFLHDFPLPVGSDRTQYMRWLSDNYHCLGPI